MRQAFVETLTQLALKNPNLILLTADLGFGLFEKFAQKFPQQFINVGVAEANMIGLAAGLSLTGKRVVVYSISTFLTMRPFEQIRNDISLHNLPVILVGAGGGLAYSDNGPTHHSTQDIALMRALPNLNIFCPADQYEVRWAVHQAIKSKSPTYLRLAKTGEPLVHHKPPNLKIGQPALLKPGADLAILATGNIVASSLQAVQQLKHSVALFSVHTIKPIDSKSIQNLATAYPLIITIEEHCSSGGLASAIAEIIAQMPNPKAQLLPLSLPDAYLFKSGSLDWLRNSVNLSPKKIAHKIITFLNSLDHVVSQ